MQIENCDKFFPLVDLKKNIEKFAAAISGILSHTQCACGNKLRKIAADAERTI